jgi:hypothetical protein
LLFLLGCLWMPSRARGKTRQQTSEERSAHQDHHTQKEKSPHTRAPSLVSCSTARSSARGTRGAGAAHGTCVLRNRCHGGSNREANRRSATHHAHRATEEKRHAQQEITQKMNQNKKKSCLRRRSSGAPVYCSATQPQQQLAL